MKRIALILLSAVVFVACEDEKVPEPSGGIGGDNNNVSLSILVPKGSVSTYANENAYGNENKIDQLFINLIDGPDTVKRVFNSTPTSSDPWTWRVEHDSIVHVSYEVDGLANTTVAVEVFANYSGPQVSTGEPTSPFFMSGKGSLTLSTTPGDHEGEYEGTVRISRNVAKLRINISEHDVIMPLDLEIEYDKVEVEVVGASNSTAAFIGGSTTGILYNIDYPKRTGTSLRKASTFNPTVAYGPDNSGGQIDSLYLYENVGSTPTVVKITIPTKSNMEGSRSVTKDYTLYTRVGGNTIGADDVLRNYIYTLNLKVSGQSMEPVVTLDIEPWSDVAIEGSILGTYLTTDVSEIVFDPVTGIATVDFCTDAQAVYFDYSGFNPPVNTIAEIGNNITSIGIEKANEDLAPVGFTDGQILLDKDHCGSFSFELNLSQFPEFPNVDFSGYICMRAGNIVKCFTFPGRKLYDAHYIVGDTLLGGEKFHSVKVIQDSGDTPNWIQVSMNRLYIDATQDTTAGPSPTTDQSSLYLHLDENLTGKTRTGHIIFKNGAVEKTFYVSQLPAIEVGRFGYTTGNTAGDDSIYSAKLYTEQLYEYSAFVQYGITNAIPVPAKNHVYNGLGMAMAPVFDQNKYKDSPYFDYRGANYSAINYCIYKNRGTNADGSLKDTDIKWYLPAQAQLMGMWTSYEAYKDSATSTFNSIVNLPVAYWSATANRDYVGEAKYMNFGYGNVGHKKMNSGGGTPTERHHTRCVRNGGASSSMVSNAGIIDFTSGMPDDSHTNVGKGSIATGDETSLNNQKLFHKLRVAANDLPTSPVVWSNNACSSYSQGTFTSGWRLPTQRELQAIWVLQHDIKKEYPAFNLLGGDYYWSGTASKEYSTNAWVVYGGGTSLGAGGSGNSPNRHKEELSRVRCVREN